MKSFVITSALSKLASASQLADAGVAPVNPCVGCDLREWCQDDCAHHLYPLFSKSEPKNFEDWLCR